MGYYLKLSFRYIRKNPARTAYSILGICLTAIMCFALVTAFYSWWDYDYLEYYRQNPYELFVPSGNEAWSAEMVENAKRMEKDEAVEELTIRIIDPNANGGSRRVMSSQMKRNETYYLQIRLKSTGDLKASAQMLADKYHFDIRINTAVAHYLRQDESEGTALTNVLLTMAMLVFGGFFVAILRNTMLIAVTERVRDYGLFRCVGMSEGQLRFLLSVEGLLMSLAAAFLGIGLGYGGLQLMTPWIRENLGLSEVFRFGFYPKAVLWTILLVVSVTLFSLIEPSRQSGQVSPLDALRGIYSNMQKRKKKKLPSGGFLEKFFGAAGFYARRNYKRGRGHQCAVFVAMFFSMAFLLTVLSYCDTLTATMKRQMNPDSEGLSDYKETLYDSGYQGGRVYVSSPYDPEKIGEIRGALEALSDVEDTKTVLSDVESLKSCLLRADPKLRALAEEKTVEYAYELAYDAEGLELERPYLTEGEIDPARMAEENGILLCDRAADGKRYTDYRPGDTIKMLSPGGAARALRNYCRALAEVSEAHGMAAWTDGRNRVVFFENGEQKTAEIDRSKPDVLDLHRRNKKGTEDTEFEQLQSEVVKALAEKGLDISPYLAKDSIFMADVLYALEDMECEAGYTVSYTVMGILSDDFYRRVRPEETARLLRIVYPLQTVTERIEEIRRQTEAAGFELPEKGLYRCIICENAFGHGYQSYIAVRRDLELLDPELLRFAARYEGWYYYNCYDDTGGMDYFEDIQSLRVARLVVVILGSFIITICMVQVINTLQANIRLRRKELWLYDVVGMSRAQRFKMQMLEHGMSAIAACILGMIGSFLFSFIFIKRILDWSGDGYVYRWPWVTALLLSAAIFGILFLVNHMEIKREVVREL